MARDAALVRDFFVADLATGAFFATGAVFVFEALGLAETPLSFDIEAVADERGPPFFGVPFLVIFDLSPAVERPLAALETFLAFGRLGFAEGAKVARTPSMALAPTLATAPAASLTTPLIVEMIPAPDDLSCRTARFRRAGAEAPSRVVEPIECVFTRLFVLARLILKLPHQSRNADLFESEPR